MIYLLFILVMDSHTGMGVVSEVSEAPSAEECLLMADYLNIQYEVDDLPIMAFCQSVRLV